MHPELQLIKQAAEGLFYISESDYPFEAVQFAVPAISLEDKLKEAAGQTAAAPVEKVALVYFLRNSTRINAQDADNQKQTAQRFLQLQNLLQQKLVNVEVYRIGSIKIDIFIIGMLPDGSYAGLRTTAIET